jgi:hypothetical protein
VCRDARDGTTQPSSLTGADPSAGALPQRLLGNTSRLKPVRQRAPPRVYRPIPLRRWPLGAVLKVAVPWCASDRGQVVRKTPQHAVVSIIHAPSTSRMASSPGRRMQSLLPSRLPAHRLTQLISCPWCLGARERLMSATYSSSSLVSKSYATSCVGLSKASCLPMEERRAERCRGWRGHRVLSRRCGMGWAMGSVGR